jgi:FG-GAP-like repeat/PASTA domain/Dockerin type I domain/Divergent InlB B-repeat domain/FG-GAP repeat
MLLRRTLALALIAGSICCAPGACGQSVTFGAAPSLPAGTSPTAVAAGVFNADGNLDLAVTNQHGVSVLMNDGSGGFLPAVNYVVGTNPQSVVAGFFRPNSEGIDDLAVVNQGSGTVSILLNNGDGTFAAGATYPAGVNPHEAFAIDLNGDSNYDLIIVDSGAGPGTGGVSILLGNGDGTFKPAVFYATGSVPLSVGVAFFNNDFALDLAVANEGSDDISILFGNGDGTFQHPVNISLDEPGISVSPTSIVTFFDNNSSHYDLAVATPNTRDITVLVGKGDGTFASPVHYALDDPNFVDDENKLVAFDLNRDRKADLVLCNLSSNHVTVLLGKGDGTFMRGVSYAVGPQPIGIATSPFQTDVDGRGNLDFNGDFIPDLVVANNAVDGEVTVLLGNGDGTLKAAPLYRSGYSPTSLAVGDLNGDGILDIVTGSSVTPAPAGTGTGAAMLGNGDGFVFGKGGGTFRSPQVWSTSPISAVALADFDGDGKLDIVETNPNPGNGNVSVLLGKGDGTFQSPVNYTVGTTPEAVAVGDFNGDGKPDIVVGNRNSNNISVLLNSGNGTLQTAVNYSTPLTGTPESIAVGDFDGDGKLDIAVAISGINASEIALFLGNGDGTFQSYLTIPAGFHSSAILHIVAADFDGDGKADIAVTDGATLSILLGSGGAAFLTPVTYLVGPGAAINGTLAVADFNGDAKPDLVTTSRDGLAIFINNGDGTFPDAPITYSPFLGGSIAVGDFDGNGTPDIVTADSSQDQTPTDTVAVLINLTTGPDVPVTIDTSPTGLTFDVYYGFPPGGVISEYTTCGVAPCTYNSGFGRFFQIYAPLTQADNAFSGLQYALVGFSDNGTSVLESSGGDLIHNVAVMTIPTHVTINYKTQELVTVLASPPNGGVVTPASGYFDADAPFVLTATANPGYTFQNWTASQQPGNPPVGGTCDTATCPQHVFAPVVWTANFAPVAVAVPNVVGQTQAAASTTITGAGLVVRNITSASSTTVAAGSVISESPAAGTQVAPGSAVDLVVSTGPPVVPHVVSFSVLFGSQSYEVIGSPRVHLPWQIAGIRVVFSEPIVAGSSASLGGTAATGFSGLGTNTLTWTISPISLASVSIVLSGSGATALKDAAGNALNAGTGFSQALKILSGDFNDDGAVSASDMVLVNNAISTPYNIYADMNGDGVVNAADVQIVRGKIGKSLP